MLYSRYGAGANDIMKMEMEEGIELLMTAQEQYAEDRMYMRWIIHYQHIGYSEFKKQLFQPRQESSNDTRSEDEILDMVERILDKNEHI